MDRDNFKEISRKVRKELEEFKERLKYESPSLLFARAREIYAKKFIADCLLDETFMMKIDDSLIPKRKILDKITAFYLAHHDEISKSDLDDMFYFQRDELKNSLKNRLDYGM